MAALPEAKVVSFLDNLLSGSEFHNLDAEREFISKQITDFTKSLESDKDETIDTVIAQIDVLSNIIFGAKARAVVEERKLGVAGDIGRITGTLEHFLNSLHEKYSQFEKECTEETKEILRKEAEKKLSVYNIDKWLMNFMMFSSEYYKTFEFISTDPKIVKEFKELVALFGVDLDIANKIFHFAFKYGLHMLLRYMYLTAGVKYDMNMYAASLMYFTSETQFDEKTLAAALETGETDKASFGTWAQSKYAKGQSICIRWLCKIRSYSIYGSKNKQFMYHFNSKRLQTHTLNFFRDIDCRYW